MEALAGSIDLTSNLLKFGSNFLGALVDQGSIYTLCPRRFKDWIKDSADSALASIGMPEGLNVLQQLGNIINNDMMKEFKNSLTNCLTKQVINNAIQKSATDLLNTKAIANTEKAKLKAAIDRRR